MKTNTNTPHETDERAQMQAHDEADLVDSVEETATAESDPEENQAKDRLDQQANQSQGQSVHRAVLLVRQENQPQDQPDQPDQ